MIKGDKIKLVRQMGAFKNVGEICEVTDVSEGGVISFRFGKYHLGCMSYEEFLKYFELVNDSENKQSRRKWTNWDTMTVEYTDIRGKDINVTVYFRGNGKKIQVKMNSGGKWLKAESSCHKDDKYDFDKGYGLAVDRLYAKFISHQVENEAKSM